MNHGSKIATILVMCVWLCGCVTATVMKEDAAALSVATGKLVGDSREFYRKLDEQKRQYWANVLLESKNCRLGWKALLIPEPGPKSDLADAGSAVWRCLTEDELDIYNACKATPVDPSCPGGQRPEWVGRVQESDLVSAEKSAALSTVAILAEYQALLAAIVQDPKFDAASELQGLEDRANQVRELIDGMTQDTNEEINFKEQRQALGALVDLIRRLREDRRDLKKLRALMSEERGAADAFDAALKDLHLRYANLDRALYIDLKRRDTDRQLREFNASGATRPVSEERIERARKILAARAEVKVLESAPNTLGQAFLALRKTHAQLRGAVVDRKYSASQRKRIATQALKQLRTWFDAISSVAKVF